MPLVILAIGIVALFGLMVGWKLNSFLALIIVSLGIGIAEGLSLSDVIKAVESGMGDTLGHLALVISFGAMLGKMMVDSGGAQVIADTLIAKFGRTHIRWAMCVTGFVVGLALFYEVGFILLIPLVFVIARSAKIPLFEVGIPMAAALSATHCFLPPHPGATAIALVFHADIGLTLLYGLIVAIPTVIIAGPLLYRTMKDMNPAIPDTLGNTEADNLQRTPGFWTSIMTTLIPVILMAAASAAEWGGMKGAFITDLLEFLGNPVIALLIAVLIGFYTFGFKVGRSSAHVMESIKSSVLAIAMIVLIIGGGGAFKQVLVDSGVARYIQHLMQDASFSPLLLGWLIAVIMRMSVGSATVAGLTAAGMMVGTTTHTDVSAELMVLAIGAGSVFGGPPNDPGFWMFKEFFNLSVKETLRSWSLMESVISIFGLIFVLLLNEGITLAA